MEIWKPADWLDGYKGVLEVSDHGRVRRTSYTYKTNGRWGTTHTTHKPDKVLSLYIEKHGYHEVAVQISGRRKKFKVHHLVARTYVNGYARGLVVNHINGKKLDNRPDNLEWVTPSQNMKHAWSTGLVDLRGENAPRHVLSSGQVRIIRKLLAIGANANMIADLVGVSNRIIYEIASGKRWSNVF